MRRREARRLGVFPLVFGLCAQGVSQLAAAQNVSPPAAAQPASPQAAAQNASPPAAAQNASRVITVPRDAVQVSVRREGEGAILQYASNAGIVGVTHTFRLPEGLDTDKLSVQQLTLGKAQAALAWVKVPARAPDGAGLELLLAAGAEQPLATVVRRAGDAAASSLELRQGRAGERVMVHTLRRQGALCGVPEAPLSVRAFDGARWSAEPPAPLSAAQKRAAQPLMASSVPSDAPALGQHLRVEAASDERSAWGLLDGDARSVWPRTKDGAGAYASFSLQTAAPLRALRLELPEPAADAIAPRAVFVLTERARYRVAVPRGARGTWQVRLPNQELSSCVALVLEGPAVGAQNGRQVAAIAEIAAELDVPPFDAAQLLAALAGRDAQRTPEQALDLLWRRPRGASVDWLAVDAALTEPGLREQFAERALEHGCDEDAVVAAVRFAEPVGTPRSSSAQRKLESCRGAATGPLRRMLTDGTAEQQRLGGRWLALLAPSAARELLPSRLGEEATRSVLWPALGKALRGVDREGLQRTYAAAPNDAARLDVAIALGAQLAEVPAAQQLVRDKAQRGTLVERYRAAAPAVRGRDEPATRALLSAEEPMLRHRALELLASLEAWPQIINDLRALAADRNPRVQAASIEWLREHDGAAGEWAPALGTALQSPWPQVQLAALRALAGIDASAKAPLFPHIERKSRDRDADVRRAALQAMAGFPAAQTRELLLERLDTEDENVSVRTQAARSLGEVCSFQDVDRLTLLARAALKPKLVDLERAVAAGALDALAALKPKDLAQRLAPLTDAKAPPTLRLAATAALQAKGRCQEPSR